MKELACFDLDGTLLHEPSLFHRSLFVKSTKDRTVTTGYLGNGVIDFVSQEVLEELAQLHGPDSVTYLQQGIRMFLRDNRDTRTREDLLEICRTSDVWPQANQFHRSVAAFAIALQQTGHHLHCETYSPQFLAEHLLCQEGISLHSSHIQFDTTTGSTYETFPNGTLSGIAYTQGDKAKSIQRRFGPEIQPTVAFGDTFSDASMLRLARSAVVVNANNDMRTFATQKGMTLLDESATSAFITRDGNTITVSLDTLSRIPAAEVLTLLAH